MLVLKHVPIRSFGENIAYIHKDCSIYKIDNIKALTRIEIHGGHQPVFAFLQIVDNNKIVRPDELGLNTEAFSQTGLPEGSKITLTLTPPAQSLAAVKRKIAGNILSAKDYEAIINDISAHRYSNSDIASFLVAVGSFVTPSEVLDLTEALRGDQSLDWGNEEIVTDYHCMDEIPGNKIDLIIAAIIAAYGLPMPKTVNSTGSSCTGVLDTMNVLANTDIDIRTFKKIVAEKRAAIANIDKIEICEADKIITAVENQNSLTTQERSIASLLATKMATGISHLLIDIPVGSRAKIKTSQEAMHLRKLIEYVSDMIGLNVDITITDGSEPIGNGIGAALEARDVMKVLKNKEDAPDDLKEKALFMAGRILEFDPKLRGGQGYLVAKEMLKSGKAFDSFEQILKKQGKKEPTQLGHLTRDIVADKAGKIARINTSLIGRIAVLAGAGQYAGAGIDLFHKVGDNVAVGDILYRIYSCNQNDFAFVSSVIESGKTGFDIE
ncbi:MAG: thymidine phosphorylase [Alphaproteobacteria bacterium]|nr:thymidine phosphorylase [Alphaproteobacteria bacterium]